MDEMLNRHSKNNIKIIINGREIPYISDYSYFDAKSFFKEPIRAADRRINKLNSYATFLTPRLKFEFALMPIGAYRVLMKLIKEFNEFIVTAYDIVEDVYVTRKMYFVPKDFPKIFSNGLEVLSIQKESFELVGTNDEIEELSLIYNKNDNTNTISFLGFKYGEEITIGDYDGSVASEDPKTWVRTGYKLTGWNTDTNGTGTRYVTGHKVFFTTSTTLYAQWEVVV